MTTMSEKENEAFVKKVARLYLSAELCEDEPVAPVETLDMIIMEAREMTGEKPDDVETEDVQRS
jgi:hypothetical protein